MCTSVCILAGSEKSNRICSCVATSMRCDIVFCHATCTDSDSDSSESSDEDDDDDDGAERIDDIRLNPLAMDDD